LNPNPEKKTIWKAPHRRAGTAKRAGHKKTHFAAFADKKIRGYFLVFSLYGAAKEKSIAQFT